MIIGTKVQTEFALLMMIVYFLNVSNKDDYEFLNENNNKLNKKKEKLIKDLIAKRNKIINMIKDIVNSNNGYYRNLIERKVNKLNKELFKAIELSKKIRIRKGIEDDPIIDLDKVVYFIAKEIPNPKYNLIVKETKELATNPLIGEGLEEEWVEKTITYFVKNQF